MTHNHRSINLRYLRYLESVDTTENMVNLAVTKTLQPLLKRLGRILGEKFYYRVIIKLAQFYVLNCHKTQELAIEMENAEKLLKQVYGIDLEEWEEEKSLPAHRLIEPTNNDELTEEEDDHTYCTHCGLRETYVELTDQGDLEGAQCYVCQEITAAAFCEGCLEFIDTDEQEGNTDGISDPIHYVYCSECGTTYETVEGEENA